MNPSMLAHPAVAEAVEKLKDWGVKVFDSDSGRMACGETGTGRLVEPEAMFEEIQAAFREKREDRPSRKILVTAGGTSESIDPVRVLTNVSTGETGVRVANALAEDGNEVTLLLAESSNFDALVGKGVRRERFRTFGDLDAKMREELKAGKYDIVIHAAAVSDYHIERIETESGETVPGTVKIQSKEPLVLRLAPNPKILDRVREYAGRKLKVISFKLATPASPGDVADLSGYESDLIVHNAVTGIDRSGDRHEGEIYERTPSGYRIRSRFRTKADLAQAITQEVRL
jgi:phosphopantothenoylcysteine decarboxylase/phosphopantothenate--cysteine ligase